MSATFKQLSFDVGGCTPDTTKLSVTGSFGIERDLMKGESVRLNLIGPDGELLASADGQVVGVSFTDKIGKDAGDVVETVRSHTVKLR